MSALYHPKRLIAPVIILLMLAGAALVYQTKHLAIEAADRVADLRGQIHAERTALSLLNAEWAVLTQPARLQDLLYRHPGEFPLSPYGIERMVRVSDLPGAPAEDPATAVANVSSPR